MAEPPPESSRTPPSSPLSEPIPPPEHSMEDRDTQGTRKRPRLDSGSRVSESLSIEGASLTPAAPASDMDVTPDPDPDAEQAPPSNKMTINVKSPGPAKSPAPAMDPESPQSSRPQPPGTDAQPQSLEPDVPSADSNVISISSSPAQSPEIEVAELEDMDQDPNTSNWRPLEEALREQGQPELVQVDEMASLADSFPKVRERLSARENLNKICQMIESGDPHDVTALTAVKMWMDDCVRNLSQLTLETYTQDSDFWEYLPSVIESLLRRGQELFMDDGSGPWTSLEELLLDYAHITAHLIRLDHFLLGLALEEPDTPVPELLSHRYLQPLNWALILNSQIPFYRALNEIHDAKLRELLLRVRERILGPSFDLAKALADLIPDLLELIPRSPGLTAVLIMAHALVNTIIDCYPERHRANGDATPDEPLDLFSDSSPLRLLYNATRSMDVKFQEWIAKKASWVSSEVSEQMLRHLLRSWTLIYAREPGFVDQMPEDVGLKITDELDLDDKFQVFSWVWKFSVLKKHLMEGRMELRVHGVEAMQSDLVYLWRSKISPDPDGLSLPFVQYLVKFFKENKIVDYLVGVDSHPQLVSRSSNIVGFLVMTSNYTDHETDTIWKTVTESQDGRIVSEVLPMLIRTFFMHPTTSPALIYLCSKFLELPLDRFEGRMLDVCDSLLGRIADKPIDQELDPTPLRLCVRLLRDSTAADNLSVEQRKELQSFGSRQLAKFINAGISDESRMGIYERCIQDIGEMNQFTVGSIQTLSALVPAHDRQEMRKLATDFDLTRLVVNNLLHLVNDANSDFSDAFTQHGLVSRIKILFRLIDMAPETITPELGQALWKEIFLSKKLGADGYKAAWSDMIGALGRSFEQNVFLDRCIHEYLPNLTPQDYSPELLSFAKQSINYEVRFNPPSTASENEVVSIPGMDRIWNFILTAQPGTIEAGATQFAIEVYLDHQIMRTSPRSAVQATHVAIVNRCIDQLKSAAPSLKMSGNALANGEDSMETDVADGDMSAEEIRFRRSLLFLHRLLHGLRARPQYKSPRASPPSLPERPLNGSPLELTWQSFDGNKSSGVNHLTIGDLSTVAELVERFTQLTGFSKFTAICGGQKLDLLDNPTALVKDVKLLHSGLIILRKAPDAQEVSRDTGKESLTSVDIEVLKHFDEIYDFLALREGIASEVYDFLLVFPPPERMLELVTSEENNEKVLFPFDKPYLAFYSFHVLLIRLREEAAKESAEQSFVKHSVDVLIAFLMTEELSVPIVADRAKFFLATMAVECLLSALSAYRPADDDAELIREPTPLIKRLLSLIEMAGSASMGPPNDPSPKLICSSFAVLVQGSMCEGNFWNAVKQEVQFDQLISALLLQESRQLVRNDVCERIKLISSPSKGPKQPAKPVGEEMETESPAETPTRIDMLATVWSAFVQNIPQTPQYASQSAEFFKVALWLFRSVAEKSPRDVVFSDYLRRWSEVMFSHRTEEFVGRETVDDLILGLAHLLEMCLNLADAANVELDTFDLAERILNTYLFPDLSPETDALIVPQIPIMHADTRQKLYSIVNLLCTRSDVNYSRVMDLLADVVPRDYSYGSNWLYDRSMMLRSPEGYAGLKNLSNTCYLNSLMTQLFMNIEFREFILGLKLAAPDSSQKLLSETQRLFAWMQDTWMKSVDPQDFVESIRTYDNDLIDISIQMDVDEFYNLLFDRWEAQVVDQEDKKKFRSFFGGQLVQQIKSKECPHISERLEPFSAIQCDIKGKASLEKSLQAYVEGEIMQGDNKYSCTACGRHVDAVKRACLKEVPDNLIFHLKRFDFDMVTMLRSKINDQFEFPDRIDMTPYNVESLSDSSAPVEPDVFELVGVLVHSGTAESGHYYSYTRERPTAGDAPSWVEFNDSDVSSFNASTIADQCFGGQTNSVQGMGGVPINKVWNAYMLFYQRVSKMEASKEVYKPLKRNCPVRVPVPLHLANHIAMENELFIRSYSLLDPCYAWLVHRLILRWHFVAEDFSKKTPLELLAVDVGLDTLEQLVARTKDHAGLDAISTEVYNMIMGSPNAADRALVWFCDRDTSMRNLILRISNADARQKIIHIILGTVKRLDRLVKSLSPADDQRDVMRRRVYLAVNRIVEMLDQLWIALQTVPRVWEDYFDLLLRMADCGPDVISILLDHRFLIKCLHIIWLDQEDRKRLRNSYANLIRMLEKGRRFSFFSMMSLCAALFANIDLSLPAVPDDEDRALSPEGKFPLNMIESTFVRPVDRDQGLSVLMKILQQDNFSNPPAVRRIVAAFLASEPGAGLLPHIVRTLDVGLRLSPADLCIPFLEATLAFCRHCHDKSEIVNLINHVAKGVDSINNSATVEHLEFFARLVTVTNERAHLSSDWFTEMVRDGIADIAPTLLIDKDRVVRQGTLDLVQLLLFTLEEQEMSDEIRSQNSPVAHELVSACVDKINQTFRSGVVRAETRLINGIVSVIHKCLNMYFDDSEEDQKAIQEVTAVLQGLQEVQVDVPDDLVSESDLPSPEDWEATSALASDSEMGLVGSP